MPDHSAGPYKFVYPEQQRHMIRVYGARAARRGIGPAYLAALKSVDHHLTTDPLAWGDPQNRLRHLRLLLCHGMREPLHAYYAADEQRRIVYVREIKPLPDQGLDEDA